MMRNLKTGKIVLPLIVIIIAGALILMVFNLVKDLSMLQNPMSLLGVSIISGSLVGLLVTLSQAQVTSNVMALTEARKNHMSDLKEAIKIYPGPLQLGDHLSKQQFSDLLKDTKNHWLDYYTEYENFTKAENELSDSGAKFKEQSDKLLPKISSKVIESIRLTQDISRIFFQGQQQKLDNIPDFKSISNLRKVSENLKIVIADVLITLEDHGFKKGMEANSKIKAAIDYYFSERDFSRSSSFICNNDKSSENSFASQLFIGIYDAFESKAKEERKGTGFVTDKCSIFKSKEWQDYYDREIKQRIYDAFLQKDIGSLLIDLMTDLKMKGDNYESSRNKLEIARDRILLVQNLGSDCYFIRGKH
ncbi:MAG: hypothetical protein QXJ24_05585 [Thermoplasmatales archaeon]